MGLIMGSQDIMGSDYGSNISDGSPNFDFARFKLIHEHPK
jgi:hypothetical protein